jgi:hypothetical protein
MQTVMRSLGMLRRFAEALGPYLLLELLLPGGTVLAALLFMYQRRRLSVADLRSRSRGSRSHCRFGASPNAY